MKFLEKGGLERSCSWRLRIDAQKTRMPTMPTPPSAPHTIALTLAAGSVSADCAETVKELGLEEMVDALCALEGVKELNMTVMKSIGLGAAAGVRLQECVTCEEKAKYRQAYVTELIALDPSLAKLAAGRKASERKVNSVKELARRVANLCDHLKKKDEPSDASTPARSTLTVVTQSEEDRETTLTSLDAASVTARRELCKVMYNLRMQPHEMAPVNQLKRVGYWVVTELCFPDPGRYPYSKMTGASTDGHLLQFRRMLLGCVVIAAGVEAPKGKRDDGAGMKDLEGGLYAPQWANANVAVDLLAQIEEKRDVLTNAEVGHVCSALSTALFKATTLGGATLSLAMAQAMSLVPQLVQNAMAVGAGQRTKVGKKPGDPLPGKQKKEAEKKKKKAEKRKREEDDEEPPGKEARGGGKYPDEEGAMGPNKLPRKTGGNPLGDQCKYIKEGRACPFRTCSFSHAA